MNVTSLAHHLARRLTLAALALCFALPAALRAQATTPNPDAPEPAVKEMSYFDATFLGMVEGITEYLPISSTGHLLLTNAILGLDDDQPLLDDRGQPIILSSGETLTLKIAADAYAIVIQFGAILAVLFLYFGRVREILLGVFGLHRNGRLLARNLLIAFLPAAVLGLLLDDWIESKLFGPLPIAIALVVGGILMLLVERWRKANSSLQSRDLQLHDLSIRQSLLVGFMQCFAMWPGTSRSMMTIVGGYLAGLRPARAAEFSFLLGLITLSAAAGYKTLTRYEALTTALDPGPILLGIAVAFVSAALAVKWLVSWLTRHGLAIFAWYRFGLAALVLLFLVR